MIVKLYGMEKPHLYYNKAQQQWTCFHWGQGYIMASTMAAAYWRWVELAGLIDRVGEKAGGKGGGNSPSTTYIYSGSFT